MPWLFAYKRDFILNLSLLAPDYQTCAVFRYKSEGAKGVNAHTCQLLRSVYYFLHFVENFLKFSCFFVFLFNPGAVRAVLNGMR